MLLFVQLLIVVLMKLALGGGAVIMELKGKVALVTGAGQSTGMAIAQGLLRAGGPR